MKTILSMLALAILSLNFYCFSPMTALAGGPSYINSSDRSAISSAMSSRPSPHKQAVLDGVTAAEAVLNGDEVSDLFVQAKAAAEEITEQTYPSDEEAALAILELAIE